MNTINEKYKKLGKNTLWMMVGNFASKLLSFFMVPLYTAYLSTADYGISDLMTTTISLLSPFLTLAASEGIIRFTLDRSNDRKQVFTLALTISGIGYLFLLLISPVLQNYTSFKDYYSLFLVYYLANNLLWILQQFIKGLDHVSHYAISGVISTLSSVTTNILLLAVLKIGVRGYLYSQIIACLIPTAYIFFIERLYIYLIKPTRISNQLVKRYINYCLPLIPNQISWWINNSSDKYILNYYHGLSLTGIYSVAYKIPTILTIVGGIFASSWQISAVEDFGSENSKLFFSSVFQKYFSLYAVATSGLLCLIKVLARFLFSNDFYNAWPFASILLLASFIQVMGQFYETIYICAMKPKMLLATTMVAAVVNISLNFAMIPSMGAYGASIATVIGYSVMLFLRVLDTRRIFKFEINIGKIVLIITLLVIQVAFLCSQFKYWIILEFIIASIIAATNRSVFKDILKILRSIIKR